MDVPELMIQDALRYMQVPISGADDETIKKIRDTYQELDKTAAPKWLHKGFSISIESGTVTFKDTTLKIKSCDLEKLFHSCSKCYILTATLGVNVDRQIGIKQRTAMLDAVMLDACASVLIEKVCDAIEEEIVSELNENEYLTMRFSPGYGDVSLDIQQQLITILDASKKIGLSLTKNNMLVPTKSITAFIGVTNEMQNRERGCSMCSMAKRCKYYKVNGESCTSSNSMNEEMRK